MIRVPPPPHKIRGNTFMAGMGISTVLADMDFETYSEAGYCWDAARNKWSSPDGAPGTTRGLGVVGAAAYSEHASTEVLTFAYDLKDGLGARVWLPGMPGPADLFDYLKSGGLVEAWNVGFERLIWLNVCRRRYGWPNLPLNQLRCAMAKARAHGLPGKLAIAGDVMDVSTKKDKEGDRLLKLFSMPRTPTKTDARRRITLNDAPDDAQRLISYNVDDIAAEAGVSLVCPDLEGDELDFWLADQAINHRGVAVDRLGVENCIAIIEQAHTLYNKELADLTGGAVMRASELAKLQQWLHGQGVHMDAMDEDAIDAQLKRLADDVQDGCTDPAEISAAWRALEIRKAVGSASVKKVFAMRLQMCSDDRLRELFSYHAARTGRPTGNGPQPTNLPKAGPKVYRCGCGRHSSNAKACTWCGVPRAPGKPSSTVEWGVDAAEDALEVIASRDLATVQHHFGDAMLTVSGCLRSLFCAGPGKELVSSDFTAIEAVVLAALAGEQWRLDVFRARTDIYLESISRSTGISVAEMKAFKAERGMHHPLRQKGKIQELSLGFGGYIGALRAFGAEGTDQELKEQVLSWRAASPAIVEFWGGQSRDFGRVPGMYGLEGAAVAAVQNPGQWYAVPRLDGTLSGISYGVKGDVLYCELPSRRFLAYHRPRLRAADQAWRGLRLTFEGYNTNAKKGPPGWMTMDLYGGLLAENCIAEKTLVLTDGGWIPIEKIEMHMLVHDGVEFVSHGGLLTKSVQPVIEVDGVWMTEDHEVLTNDGWIPARQNPRPLRPALRFADGYDRVLCGREETALEIPVRLRQNLLESRHGGEKGHPERQYPQLRVPNKRISGRVETHARDVPAPSFRGVEVDAGSVQTSNPSILAQLWRAGHQGLRKVAALFRELLVGHGPDVCARVGDRTERQHGGVLPGELHLGNSEASVPKSPKQQGDRHPCRQDAGRGSRRTVGAQCDDATLPSGSRLAGGGHVPPAGFQSAQVYDILNCGPRNRFVVRGQRGPFVVHNCTQAVARDIQRHAIVTLERRGYPVVLHVYDEDVCEVPVGWGSVEELESIMSTMPDWAHGWPISASGGWRHKRYQKA